MGAPRPYGFLRFHGVSKLTLDEVRELIGGESERAAAARTAEAISESYRVASHRVNLPAVERKIWAVKARRFDAARRALLLA